MLEVDTIAAVSTAPGNGALAVVRCSGGEAGRVLLRLAPALRELPKARCARLAEIRDPRDGTLLDVGVVTFFPGPASYTGEDVVEISCHGGWLGPELVLEACVRAGARRAEPGEFTRRAYLHRKLDLVQAEAVADLIEARSAALRRAALGQLERGLSARIGALREALVGLEAELAHHIDFPEEDDAPVPVEAIVARAGTVAEDMRALLRSAPEGELLREGALVVLAGRPNSGKSALYNALIGEERAIVTAEPGTTRDALLTTVQLGGFPFRLVDTAGLREAEGRVEQMGIEVTRRYLGQADVVLLCVPADEEVGEMEHSFLGEIGATPVVLVRTKGDATNPVGATVAMRGGPAGDAPTAPKVRTSAVTGEGLDELGRALTRLMYAGLAGSSGDVPVLTRARQREALAEAARETDAFVEALGGGLPPEVAATHLRAAGGSLEELLGVITTEDVLDALFARFCVGK